MCDYIEITLSLQMFMRSKWNNNKYIEILSNNLDDISLDMKTLAFQETLMLRRMKSTWALWLSLFTRSGH